MNTRTLDTLRSPWAVLVGCVIGILLGYWSPATAHGIKFIGDGYLALLKMCVLPIMLSAVISGIGKILEAESSNRQLGRLLVVFALLLSFSCVVGLGAGLLTSIGINQEQRQVIGNLLLGDHGEAALLSCQSSIIEIDTTAPPPATLAASGLSSFFLNMIPTNVFASLSTDQAMQALFFFLVFGLSLKSISLRDRTIVLGLFDAIFNSFQNVVRIILLFLPFGLCALLANQFVGMNGQVISAMLGFMALTYVASLLVLVVSSLVIWRYSGQSYLSQFAILREPILIALSTRSSFPTLPSALNSLINDMHLNPERTSLVVSLGHTLCKYGKSMMFCLGAVYSLYLYSHAITATALVIIFVSSIFTGMAASGAPSIISRTMISLVLAPLGVPAEAIIVIMLAIDPLTDPIITLVSTYPNYAAATVVAGRVPSGQLSGPECH